MSLLRTEMRRALHRRAVRVLILIALFGCAMAGTVSWFGSRGKSVAELRFDDEGHPAVMTDWWIADANEGFLAIAMFFLMMGGFFGGATVAGGEVAWRRAASRTSEVAEARLAVITASTPSARTASASSSTGCASSTCS